MRPQAQRAEFVFFDKDGQAVAAAVGRVPKEVLLADAEALASGDSVPYASIQDRSANAVSSRPGGAPAPKQASPLSHG